MSRRVFGWWWRRHCICTHSRSMHGDGRGWRVCHALRCDCLQFAWAPIARAEFILTGRVRGER